MAKITITIEDGENGKIRFISKPSFREIANAVKFKGMRSASYKYAIYAINAVLIKSKELEKIEKSGIIIPPES